MKNVIPRRGPYMKNFWKNINSKHTSKKMLYTTKISFILRINSNPKSKNDAKKVIKDNAQAGIPAKRDFFAFFPIIESLNFYSYIAQLLYSCPITLITFKLLSLHITDSSPLCR